MAKRRLFLVFNHLQTEETLVIPDEGSFQVFFWNSEEAQTAVTTSCSPWDTFRKYFTRKLKAVCRVLITEAASNKKNNNNNNKKQKNNNRPLQNYIQKNKYDNNIRQ